MKSPILITAAVAALLLSACKPAAEAPSSPAAPEAAAPAPAIAPMPAATDEAKQATAVGVVQSVDTGAQTLEIAHEAVPALDWPAMTMTFKSPGVDLAGLQPGDRIEFDLSAVGMDGTISAIRKQ